STWTQLLQGLPVQINRRLDDTLRFRVPFGDPSRRSNSLMYVPIIHAGQVSGVISVQSYASNKFSDADIEMLQRLARLCGPAVLRCRAEERSRDLLRLGLRLNPTTTTRGVARVVADTAADLLGWDAFSIHLLDSVDQQLHL